MSHMPDAIIQSIRFSNLELDDPMSEDDELETPPAMTLVGGGFATRVAAARTVESLLRAGTSVDAISVLMSEMTRARHFGRGQAPGGGALAQLAVGCMFVPTVGMCAAGPLLNSLWIARATPSAAGLAGALIVAGLLEREAVLLAAAVQMGGILIVAAVAQDRAWGAREIMRFVRQGKLV